MVCVCERKRIVRITKGERSRTKPSLQDRRMGDKQGGEEKRRREAVFHQALGKLGIYGTRTTSRQEEETDLLERVSPGSYFLAGAKSDKCQCILHSGSCEHPELDSHRRKERRR